MSKKPQSIEEKLEDCEAENKEFKAKIDELKSEVEHLENKISKYEDEIDALENDLELLEDRSEKQARINDLVKDFVVFGLTVGLKTRSIEEFRKELEDVWNMANV